MRKNPAKRLPPKKTVKTSFSNKIWIIPLLAGILLILTSLTWNFYEATKLSFIGTSSTKLTTATNSAAPTFIYIPKIDLALNVNETAIKNGIWQISGDGASHLNTSGSPGEKGNIVIYSHNTSSKFGPVRNLKLGDRIYILTRDGINHKYTVVKTTEVDPTNLKVIAPTEKETLTLFTCTGFADLKRFVVIAYPNV